MATRFTREVLKGTTKNPAGDFNQSHQFTIEIEGITIGGVNKVDGLETEHEVTQYQDSDDLRNRARPGKAKVKKVTIERDWASNSELFDWFNKVYEGNVERKSMSIVLLTDNGNETMRFNLTDAWPSKWQLSNLNARQSGHVTETCDIMYEQLALA